MAYRKVGDIRRCENCTNGLVPAATHCTDAKRFVRELGHSYRTPFARDRDRIIHSLAFQRLVHKTQLFPAADPSKYTTRLLHSIKVAQISQTVSRALRLNEDLTVAIALGHDLGHAPFGHIGEDIIRKLLINDNGFEHNEESVLVSVFFDPKNLTTQTLEGILKHTRFSFAPYETEGVARQNPFNQFRLPGRSQRNYRDPFQYWDCKGPDNKLLFRSPASYEGQVVDIADEVAYISHDVADLMAKGIVRDLDLPDEWLERFGNDPSNAIDGLVNGVIDENWKGIAKEKPSSRAYQVKHPADLDRFVELMKDWFYDFIHKPAARKQTREVESILTKVFNFLCTKPGYAYRIYPFGREIVKRGFKGKLLAGHLLASLTDNEARQLYSKIP